MPPHPGVRPRRPCGSAWLIRNAIPFFNLTGFECHPDKAQPGKIPQGFDWPGVWFTDNGATGIAPRAKENPHQKSVSGCSCVTDDGLHGQKVAFLVLPLNYNETAMSKVYFFKKNEQVRNCPNVLCPPRARKWQFYPLLMACTAISFSAQCRELNFSCTATSLMNSTIFTSTKSLVNNRPDRRETQVYNSVIYNETILDSQGTTVATPELLSLFRASLLWRIRYLYVDNEAMQHWVLYNYLPDTGRLFSTSAQAGPTWIRRSGEFSGNSSAIDLEVDPDQPLDDVPRTIRFGFTSSQTVIAMPSTLPVVGNNEYANRTITYTAVFKGVDVQISNQVAGGYGQPPGPMTFAKTPTNNITTITCTREAIPLTLLLTDREINFGSVLQNAAPVVRTLGWSTSGSGEANSWTLKLDVPDDSRDRDEILLGGAKIAVLDANGVDVPLSVPVNISGTKGELRLILKPESSTIGEAAPVNLTLTVSAS